MRLNKAIINSSLVLLLALGLGGCAANNSASTHKASHEPASAKVTKANNHKKAASDSNDQSSANPVTANQAVTAAPASYANVNQPASVANPALINSNVVASGNQAAVASRINANQNSQVARPAQNTQQAVNNDEEHELPAPLYYYWVWKDEQGRTHNVDWDLLDMINQNGKVTSADYIYEQDPNAPIEFPSHAVQYDSREFNIQYSGNTEQWILDLDNQINANPNHGVVNRMN